MTIYNFSAGPATLPKPVLEKAQAELLNYQDSGMSVLEMSHRSPEFDKIVKDAEATLRELMAIPDNYKVFSCKVVLQHNLQWSHLTSLKVRKLTTL